MDMFDISDILSLHGGSVPIELVPPEISRASSAAIFREACRADTRQIAELFRDTYGDSSHPCADEAGLTVLLDSHRMQMIVATDHGRIVGCVAANALRTAGVMELGCLVVHRDYHRFRLANQLHSQIVDHVTRDPGCHLVIAFVRGPSIYRLANRHPRVSLRAWGHDGGMNIARTEREHHVLAIGANPAALIRRARPTAPLAVVERVLGRLENICTVAREPSDIWTAPSLWDTSESNATPSCIELAAPARGGSCTDALAWVASESTIHARIPHQFVFATLDRPEFTVGLRQQGFSATAYLPAWMPDGDVRRDCLLMVKRHEGIEAAKRGFDSIIDAWNRRLQNARMSSVRS